VIRAFYISLLLFALPVHAQTLSNFSVTKAAALPYEGETVSLDLHSQNRFLLICAADLSQFSSEKKALQASDEVGGVVITADLAVRFYRNLFSYGPGFVYFNDLTDGQEHISLGWAQLAIQSLKHLKISQDQFLLDAGNIRLQSGPDGKAKIQVPRGYAFRQLNRYRFYCEWKRDLTYDSSKLN